MMTCDGLTDCEYYLDTQGADPAARTSTTYYTDSKDSHEHPGVLWAPKLKETASNFVKALRIVQDGAYADPTVCRRLALGREPRTGQEMLKHARGKRKAGWDCQFSVPKSVSAFRACGTPEIRKHIDEAMLAAAREMIDYCFRMGLIITRAGKGGKEIQTPEDLAGAMWLHLTSRKGDPQEHVHFVLFNYCTRADGKAASIDNSKMLEHQNMLGSLFKCEFVKQLRQRLPFHVNVQRKEPRGFELGGVPEQLIELWSKRRKEVEAELKKHGINSTAEARAAATVAAKATRENKSDVPDMKVLEARWDAELTSIGWTRESVVEAVRASGRQNLSEQSDASRASGLRSEELRRRAIQHAGNDAVKMLIAQESVLERRTLVDAIAERMQHLGGVDAVEAEFARLVADKVLTPLTDDEGVVRYTTPAMYDIERDMLRLARDRKGERIEGVTEDLIAEVFAQYPTLAPEQAAVARWMLTQGGVALGTGDAGTGKTFMSAVFVDVLRRLDKPVFGIAPSHKAKSVLYADLKMAMFEGEDASAAVTGFLNRITNPDPAKRLVPPAGTVILVDEAAMVSTTDVHRLLTALPQCHIRLLGDAKQLSSPAAGCGFRALAGVLGDSRLSEIRRQREDWAREASKAFAVGNVEPAVAAYEAHGCVHWVDGKDESVDVILTHVDDHLTRCPEKTRLVLASTNADVKLLNERLRVVYQQHGMVGTEDIELAAFTRGKRPTATTIAISTGERVMFNATVKAFGVNNADTATIVSIERVQPEGGQGDVRVRVKVKLDKGGEFEAFWDEIIGHRKRGEARIPKISAGYATTVSASQGSTVDACWVLDCPGVAGGELKREAAYVAMTRHREESHLVVDTSVVRALVAARKAERTIVVHEKGMEADDAEDRDDSDVEVTDDEIKEYVLGRMKKSGGKKNVSDFLDCSLAEWIDSVPIAQRAPKPPKPEEKADPALVQHRRQKTVNKAPPAASKPAPFCPQLDEASGPRM